MPSSKGNALDETTISLRITLRADAQIGPGKAALLVGIRDTGSISAAGRRMGISGGTNTKTAGWVLDRRTWDEMPTRHRGPQRLAAGVPLA